MQNFAPEDVVTVAKAVVDNAIDHEVGYGMNLYDECIYCGASNYAGRKIQHKQDCPFLVARDLLTNSDS